MTKEDRNVLLQSALLHLEAVTDMLRVVIADELVGAAQPSPADEPVVPATCPHPPKMRRALTTLGGGGAGREMCRDCGLILENGKPVLDDSPAGGGS